MIYILILSILFNPFFLPEEGFLSSWCCCGCCFIIILLFSSHYLTCTNNPARCYTGDGTLDKSASCTSNTQCATQCCYSSHNYCLATYSTTHCKTGSTNNSSAAGIQGWTIALIVIGVVLVLGLIIFLRVLREK